MGQRLLARWPDGVATLLVVGAAIGLLAYRRSDWRGRGGLSGTFEDERGATVAQRRFPTADIDRASWPSRAHRVTWGGWIWVPARGYFVFGVHYRGSVELEVAGKTLIKAKTRASRSQGHRRQLQHPRQLAKNILLVDKGWQAVRLRYEPAGPKAIGCRLVWQPPGRRGILEYVDPSSLRPGASRPSRAGPSAPPRVDAWVATLLVGLCIGWLLWWVRRRIARFVAAVRADRALALEAGLCLGLLAVGLAIRLWGLDAAGQTWDEDVYFGAGRNYLYNLLALDWRPDSWLWNYEHPPIGKYIAGLGSLWSESMTVSRFLSALLGGASVLATYLCGRLLLGRWVGAIGAALVAVSPHLIGHSKIVAHESASVAFYSLAVLCYLLAERQAEARLTRDADRAPSPTLWFGLCGLFAGLALCTRWLNGAVLLLLGAFFLLSLWPQRKSPGGQVSMPAGVLLVPVIAFGMLILTWPRLWSSPTTHLGEAFTYYPANLAVTEIFLGKVRTPPLEYFLVYFSATVPSGMLLGWILFVPAWLQERTAAHLRLALWWVVPLAAGHLGPMKQDGMRYILPLLVPTALMAAVGLQWTGARLAGLGGRWSDRWRDRREVWARRLAGGIAAAVIVSAGWACLRSHPYYIDYYNALWGGPESVFRRRMLEFSWWGEGLTPTVRYLNGRVPKGGRVFIAAAARHMMVLRTDIRVVRRPSEADYLVFADQALYQRAPPGFRLLHAERVGGTPVVKVFVRQ